MEFHVDEVSSLLAHIAKNRDVDIVLFLLLVVAAGIVLKSLHRSLSHTASSAGFGQSSVIVSVDGVKTLPEREYISEMQGLAGRPDAVIIEGGFFIPVERKPLARKIRDRYVAQLLVYMRLIEEFEGKRPPYGYLVLGPSARKVKIENSTERQAWLDNTLSLMRGVMQGESAVPDPQREKCIRCDVRSSCAAFLASTFQENSGERKKIY